MPFPSNGHFRFAKLFSRDRQGRVINHSFASAPHSLLQCTIAFPYSTDIPLSFNALFTPSIPPVFGLILSLTPLTSDHTILFTNRSSSFSSYVQTISIHTALFDQPTFVTPVLLCTGLLTFSYHTHSLYTPLQHS